MKLWHGIVAAVSLLLTAVYLFPLLSNRGRRTPERTACVINLKQIAMAHLMYAGDYDDRFPDRDVWMDVVFPYIKNKDIYHCPGIQREEPQLEIYGYCFNAELSRAKLPPLNLELKPLAFDSVNLARNASGFVDSLPSPGRHKSETADAAYNTIAYADGHAKAQLGP